MLRNKGEVTRTVSMVVRVSQKLRHLITWPPVAVLFCEAMELWGSGGLLQYVLSSLGVSFECLNYCPVFSVSIVSKKHHDHGKRFQRKTFN